MSRKNDETEQQGAREDAGIPKDTPAFRAIEEHAKTLGISEAVFAAVRQYKGWAAGKKVERSEFEKAVNDFLSAPAGGK